MKIFQSIFISIAVAGYSVIPVSATIVETTGGNLAERLSTSSADITELTLSGTISTSDLKYIADSLPNLESLDMSAITSDSIGAWSLFGLKAKSLKLPSSLKVIGNGALGAIQAEEVELPSTLQTIGNEAFAGAMLKTVTVPAGVSSVGTAVFKHCPQLENVVWGPSEIPAEAFTGDKNLSTVGFPENLSSIGADAFTGCALTEINLADYKDLTQIGAGAFSECTSLESATLPAALKNISSHLFMGCTALKCVEFGNATVYIGDYALASASAIETLALPSTVNRIDTKAMAEMTSLNALDVSDLDEVPTLGDDVWEGVDQPEVTLTAGEETAHLFKQADQWNLFKITTSSGIDEVGADNIAGSVSQATVNARIEGNEIIIEASDPIVRAILFDAAGNRFADIAPNAAEASVSIASIEPRVWVLTVRLSDNSVHNFKLAKR